jgi:hypothetical protein
MIRFLAVRHSARVDFGEKFCQVLSSRVTGQIAPIEEVRSLRDSLRQDGSF